jgi:hypothetical protein
MIKWVRSNGCPWYDHWIYSEIDNINEKLIDILYDNGLMWETIYECDCQGQCCHTDIIKWIHYNWCPRFDKPIEASIYEELSEILEQASKKGSVFEDGLSDMFWQFATNGDHFKTIVIWGLKKGFAIDMDKIRTFQNMQLQSEIEEWDMYVMNRNRVVKKIKRFMLCAREFVLLYEEVKLFPGNTTYLEALASFEEARKRLMD